MEPVTNAGGAARMSKRDRRAPCCYMAYNERMKKDVETYPDVNCGCDCANCGWNPAVAEKRIQKLLDQMAKEGRKL